MAETLEQIYFNTSLGATELDDGEQTILTTDANTRYVIKDVLVKDNTGLTSKTYLELNGFNIGALTGNSSGSLIIPPSSTLKIKTTDYPFSFYEETQYAGASSSFGVQHLIYQIGSDTPTLTIGSHANTAPSSPGNVTDAIYSVSNSGTPYFHYSLSDNNSSQSVYYMNAETGSPNSVAIGGSYTPFGLSKRSAYGTTSWGFTSAGSTSIRYVDLLANPTTATYVTPTNIGGGAQSNSYTPGSTTSYPRGHCHHGYYFYVPSSSYSNTIYGINLTNGAFLTFNLTGGATLSSQNANFTVAYDKTNDKFVFYRPPSTSSLLRSVFSTTKTEMDAVTTTASYSSPTETSISAPSQYQTNMSGAQLGYDHLGNVSYRNTSGSYVTIDASGAQVSSATSFSIDGTTVNLTNGYPFNRKVRYLTVSEADALGVSAPTFGVQILGVKSVV